VRKIQLFFILTAMALICSCSGIGQVSSSSANVPRYDWYVSQEPNDMGKLTDEGLQGSQSEKNGLLIVDSTGKNSNTTLDIPADTWARLKISPSAGGELEVYSLYPTGSADLLANGSVTEGHSYRAWYQAEQEGDYEVWYTLNGAKSNSVLFHVVEGATTE